MPRTSLFDLMQRRALLPSGFERVLTGRGRDITASQLWSPVRRRGWVE
ncbi:hypothetical protein [Gordonia rhizosphera]|nr:hypothetical protein [Gordonia rhizosphera]